MPNKIIVPTDFSTNSKAGIRFAIQLASQNDSTLVFYHCMELLKPMKWTNGQFNTYVKNQLSSMEGQLKTFVEKCYDSGAVKGKFECVVERGSDPKKSVVKYAVAVKAAAICLYGNTRCG
jgi:nucleotide-binding universal stress UspA family protein